MSLYSRRYLLLSVGALGACGFKPLYGPETAAEATQGRIDIAQIGGLMGYNLRQRLSARLGAASAPSHLLTVQINTSSQELAINPQNEITRYSLTGNAVFDLRQKAGNVSVLRGDVRAFSAYSATASAYATSVAERDARERLANSLAEQIATRIVASADRWLS